LKHTVYFHDGNTTASQIISSISWLYDNTKGIMSSYPFYEDNANTALSDGAHDVMFVPIVVQDNTYLDINGILSNRYDRTDNYNPIDGGMIPGGTINYFPYDEIVGSTNYPIPNYFNDEFSVYDPLSQPPISWTFFSVKLVLYHSLT
jgi:hypothetical protein